VKIKKKLSIIIPVYNSEETIEQCISTVSEEVKKYIHEIIVIDDCSTDKTQNILNKFKNIKLIRLDKNMGVGYARNKGIEYSKYDILCYIDADLIISKNSIYYLLEKIGKDKKIGSVGGIPVLPNLNKKDWSSNFVALKSLFGFRDVKLEWEVSEVQSEFFVIDKKFLKKIGGWKFFRNAGGEEYELGNRIKNNGKKNYKLNEATYTTSWDNLFTRFKEVIDRTEKYLHIFVKKKEFETEESFASSEQAMSAIFTSILIFLIFINFFTRGLIVSFCFLFFWIIQLFIERNFLLYAQDTFGFKMFFYSLYAIQVINTGILIGGLLFLYNLFIKNFKKILGNVFV
jgi:glycosyltransferase involved in cell wall biosynthesis|tara:strand:- start:468 stop:1496 length:1029 start_codon:yes stop_codon:yes gene_type:complete